MSLSLSDCTVLNLFLALFLFLFSLSLLLSTQRYVRPPSMQGNLTHCVSLPRKPSSLTNMLVCVHVCLSRWISIAVYMNICMHTLASWCNYAVLELALDTIIAIMLLLKMVYPLALPLVGRARQLALCQHFFYYCDISISESISSSTSITSVSYTVRG